MFTDYKTATFNRLWQLLEAEPQVTTLVTTANRVKLTKAAGWLQDLFTGRASTDFPQIKINVGQFTNTAYTLQQTFGMNAVAFAPGVDCDPMVERTAQFPITVVSDIRKIGDSDTLEEAVQLALLKGGPKLGLSYVIKWTMTANQQTTDTNEARGTYRLVSRMTMAVTMRFRASTLLT